MSFITLKSIPRITFAYIYEPYSKMYTLRPVPESCIEVGFLKKGIMLNKLNGKTFTFNKGDIFCHTHKKPVDVKFLGACELHTVIFYFDAQNSEQRTEGSFYIPLLPERFPQCEQGAILCKLIDELIVVYNTADKSSVYALSLLFQIICIIDKHSNDIGTRETESAVPFQRIYTEKIKKYIFDNLNRHVTLDELASHLDLSAPYLCSVFKKTTGESIIHYTNTLKLYKIKELLYNQNLSLSQAGEQVGISDVHYISRMFKKYLNMNISEFRKSRFEEKF